jgi:26S proteasome regulatory subunit N8
LAVNGAPSAVLVCVDPHSESPLDLPIAAYTGTPTAGATTSIAFDHIPSEVGALEAEEVGVEHLLRDVHDASVSTLAQRLSARSAGLASLSDHLETIQLYLSRVSSGTLPLSHEILGQLQALTNVTPADTASRSSAAFAAVGNDEAAVLFVASLSRAVVGLHGLVLNKRECAEAEAEQEQEVKGEAKKVEAKKVTA